MCACVKFDYGGCLGNKNNFELYKECEDMCLSFTTNTTTSYRERKGTLLSRRKERISNSATTREHMHAFKYYYFQIY